MMETHVYSVLSVMGPHAGEDSEVIFARKIADIRNAGHTFWVIRSHKAKPDMIQMIGRAVRSKSLAPLCAFIAPSTPGGAVPTKTSSVAAEYSADRCEWKTIPANITPVTGRMSPNTGALVFDQIYHREFETVNLWDYAEFFNPEQPVRIQQGASTVGVMRGDTSTNARRMKSHLRQVMAVGRLVEPFAVWLR